MTSPALTSFAGPQFGLQAEPLRQAGIRPQGPLPVRAQPLGGVPSTWERPGANEMAPTVTSFAAPQGGVPSAWERPGAD